MDAKELASQQQHNQPCDHVPLHSIRSSNLTSLTNSSNKITTLTVHGAEEEMQLVQNAMEEGVVYLMGEAEVVAKENSSFFKKVIVNCFYNCLRNNFRQKENVLAIPRSRLLRVGMMYEI